jgi:hypothetical protein
MYTCLRFILQFLIEIINICQLIISMHLYLLPGLILVEITIWQDGSFTVYIYDSVLCRRYALSTTILYVCFYFFLNLEPYTYNYSVYIQLYIPASFDIWIATDLILLVYNKSVIYLQSQQVHLKPVVIYRD